MDNNSAIDQLLQKISSEEGEGFSYNRDKIIKDLAEQRAVYSNWGISLLSVIGGVLAAVFFIGFLLLAGLYDSPSGMLILGFLFIAGSVWVNKVVKSLLLDTATISFYIAGYAMLLAGFFSYQGSDNLNLLALICLILSLAVIFITDSAMLVFISVLIGNGSLLSLIISDHAYSSIHFFIAFVTAVYTYISLSETTIISKGKGFNTRFNPVRTGFLLSLIGGMAMVAPWADDEIRIQWVYVSSVILIIAVLFTVYKITQSLGVRDSKQLIPVYAISFLVLMPTLFAPAIAGSLLILVLGFYNGYKLGFISGILALIYFVSRYYYDLHFTLLTKSVILIASGILFLVLFFVLKKQLQSNG